MAQRYRYIHDCLICGHSYPMTEMREHFEDVHPIANLFGTNCQFCLESFFDLPKHVKRCAKRVHESKKALLAALPHYPVSHEPPEDFDELDPSVREIALCLLEYEDGDEWWYFAHIRDISGFVEFAEDVCSMTLAPGRCFCGDHYHALVRVGDREEFRRMYTGDSDFRGIFRKVQSFDQFFDFMTLYTRDGYDCLNSQYKYYDCNVNLTIEQIETLASLFGDRLHEVPLLLSDER